VQEALERLRERELVVRHPRRPGQKEDRWEQVLGGDEEIAEAAVVPPGEAAPAAADPAVEEQGPQGSEDRLDRLERELAALRTEVGDLRRALGEDS